jgi:hypothetical protein
VDAVLLSGDLSYANGYLANWDFFLDSLAPIAGNSTICMANVVVKHSCFCYHLLLCIRECGAAVVNLW